MELREYVGINFKKVKNSISQVDYFSLKDLKLQSGLLFGIYWIFIFQLSATFIPHDIFSIPSDTYSPWPFIRN